MSKSRVTKTITVKILDFCDIHRITREILRSHGYKIGDIIKFSNGYYDDDIGGMAWPKMSIIHKETNSYIEFNADDYEGIYAFCTSFCIKESNHNIYSSYSLI